MDVKYAQGRNPWGDIGMCLGMWTFGLAMIIGAYSAGLALSDTPLARRIREPLGAVYQFLAPVFFVVMAGARIFSHVRSRPEPPTGQRSGPHG